MFLSTLAVVWVACASVSWAGLANRNDDLIFDKFEADQNALYEEEPEIMEREELREITEPQCTFDMCNFVDTAASKYMDPEWYKENGLDIKDKSEVKSWMMLWQVWKTTSKRGVPTNDQFKCVFGNGQFDIDWWRAVRHNVFAKHDSKFHHVLPYFWWIKEGSQHYGQEDTERLWSIIDDKVSTDVWREKATSLNQEEQGPPNKFHEYLNEFKDYTNTAWYRDHGLDISDKSEFRSWMLIFKWWINVQEKAVPTMRLFRCMFGDGKFATYWWTHDGRTANSATSSDKSVFSRLALLWWVENGSPESGRYGMKWLKTVTDEQTIANFQNKHETEEEIHKEEAPEVQGEGQENGEENTSDLVIGLLREIGGDYIHLEWYREHGWPDIQDVSEIKPWMLLWCFWSQSRGTSPSKDQFHERFGNGQFDTDWWQQTKGNENEPLDPGFSNMFAIFWWWENGADEEGQYGRQWLETVADKEKIKDFLRKYDQQKGHEGTHEEQHGEEDKEGAQAEGKINTSELSGEVLHEMGDEYTDLQWYDKQGVHIKDVSEIQPWMILWRSWKKARGQSSPSKDKFLEWFGNGRFDTACWKRVKESGDFDKSFIGSFPIFWWAKSGARLYGRYGIRWLLQVADCKVVSKLLKGKIRIMRPGQGGKITTYYKGGKKGPKGPKGPKYHQFFKYTTYQKTGKPGKGGEKGKK